MKRAQGIRILLFGILVATVACEPVATNTLPTTTNPDVQPPPNLDTTTDALSDATPVARPFRPMENIDPELARRPFQWVGEIRNLSFGGTVGEVIDECSSQGVPLEENSSTLVAECTFARLSKADWARPKIATFTHASGISIKKLISPNPPTVPTDLTKPIVVTPLSTHVATILLSIARINASGMFFALPQVAIEAVEQALALDDDVKEALEDENLKFATVQIAFNDRLNQFPLLGTQIACVPVSPYAEQLRSGGTMDLGSASENIALVNDNDEETVTFASATIDEHCQLDSVNGISFPGLTAGGTPQTTLEAGQSVIAVYTATDAPISDNSLSSFVDIRTVNKQKGAYCEVAHHQTPSGTEDVDVKWWWVQLGNGEVDDAEVRYHTMPFVAHVLRFENLDDDSVSINSGTRTCYGPFNELVTYPDDGDVGDEPTDETQSVVFWEDGALNGAMPGTSNNVFLLTVPGIRKGALEDGVHIVLRDEYDFGVGPVQDGIKDTICVEYKDSLTLDSEDDDDEEDAVVSTSIMHVIGAINGAIPFNYLAVFDACDQMQAPLPNTGLEGTRVADEDYPLTPVEVLFSCARSNAFVSPRVMEFMGDEDLDTIANFNHRQLPNVFVAGSLGINTEWKVSKGGENLATVHGGPQGQASLAIPDLAVGDKLEFRTSDSDLPGGFSFEVPVHESCAPPLP